jgi:hypothetical protein
MSNSWIQELLGDTLLRPDGTTVARADALSGKEVLGLYFSAHWWCDHRIQPARMPPTHPNFL